MNLSREDRNFKEKPGEARWHHGPGCLLFVAWLLVCRLVVGWLLMVAVGLVVGCWLVAEGLVVGWLLWAWLLVFGCCLVADAFSSCVNTSADQSQRVNASPSNPLREECRRWADWRRRKVKWRVGKPGAQSVITPG